MLIEKSESKNITFRLSQSMSVIWIIEKPDETDHSVAARLMGDFPVRLFASFNSFRKLYGVNQKDSPNIIIIVNDYENYNINNIEQEMSQCCPRIKRVYIGFAQPSDPPPVSQIYGTMSVHIQQCNDGLSLSGQIRRILESLKQDKSCSLRRYKNISLDFEKLLLRVFPDHNPISLPLKEARILKLFMDHPGRCLSREKIKNEIWENLAVSSRTIDSHISRLRKRLIYAEPTIENVYGGGYIFM